MTWRTVKTVWWSAIGGAIVWWIVLSAVFGWMSPGSAMQQAKEQAGVAVLDALAPICVARFEQDVERDAKLVALQKENTWQRDDFVIKQGWAAVLGSQQPRTGVAAECASRILATNRS